MIKKEMTLGEIISKYPVTINVFKSKNISGFDDPAKSMIFNKLSLEITAKTKKINLDVLLDTLNTAITDISTDITTEKREYKKNGIDTLGLLPCPIRLPLLEAFKNFDTNNPKVNLNYDLKAASSGSEWMKEFIETNDAEKIPDIFLSTGFELFFSNNIKDKLKNKKLFKDITGLDTYNNIFNDLNLKDPYGNYAMLGVVPAVMLINKEELKGRKIPDTWEDLLSPEFEKSISIPLGDLDLYNAVIVTLHSKFGDAGIEKLKNNFLINLHPSQMIKADKLKENKPAVTIIPYFFTKMLPKNSGMTMHWPKDGAVLSPIFMLIKNDDNNEKLEKTAKFLSSKETGSILANQGYFPSIHPEVDNNMKDKNFIWAGWDYLYNNDIDSIIKNCTKILNQNTQEV